MDIEIFTTGYPKSGTTWLNRLLSAALDSPLQTPAENAEIDSRFCETGKGGYVIRKTHWTRQVAPDPLPKRLVFIQRDPRDVAISAMYYRSLEPTNRNLTKTLVTMVGGKPSDGLPFEGIYEKWVRRWLEETEVVMARYEWLHTRPKDHLMDIIWSLTGKFLWPSEIDYAIKACDIREWQKQDSHFFRKGIMGDWKNHFKRAHGEYMDEHLGEFMLEFGYIKDRDWWKKLPKIDE